MTDRLGTPFERKVLRGGFSVRELSDSLASRRFSFLHCADSPLSECTGFPCGSSHKSVFTISASGSPMQPPVAPLLQ